MTTSPASAPRRILVRGVNWLGDAVMTTPALQRLHERFPDSHITLLTPEKLSQLWLHHPSIDDVMAFGPDATAGSVASSIWTSQFVQGLAEGAEQFHRQSDSCSTGTFAMLAKRVASKAAGPEPFDLAVVLPNSPRSALETWLARIPQRIGYARPWRSWLLTKAIPARPDRVKMRRRSTPEITRLNRSGRNDDPRPTTKELSAASHQIHEYLHLVAALGGNPEPVVPALNVTSPELREAEEKLFSLLTAKSKCNPGQLPILLGLNPGAEYGPAKRWPAENFAAVVREVSRRLGNCAWVAFGREKDSKLCERIGQIAGGDFLNLAGKTSLRELMASLKLCRVLLTNDSGPMHVAAALGTAVVVPFGSTSPELTGPGLPGETRHKLLKSTVPCSPCFRRTCPIDFRCMTGITPGAVIGEVLKVLDSSKA